MARTNFGRGMTMSRLIDADALPIVAQGKNHHRKYVFADITDAPTIDAIPVEWLRQQYHDNPTSALGNKCRFVYMEWQELLLESQKQLVERKI